MAIKLRECICGCGNLVLGTARRKYYNEACKQRVFRRNKQIKLENKDAK